MNIIRQSFWNSLFQNYYLENSLIVLRMIELATMAKTRSSRLEISLPPINTIRGYGIDKQDNT